MLDAQLKKALEGSQPVGLARRILAPHDGPLVPDRLASAFERGDETKELLRYLLDPDPAAPFFVDIRKPTIAKIEIISNCGFERSM